MLSNERLKYTDKEIIEKGSRALIRELGYSGFIRFIRYSEGLSEEDYLKFGAEIFKDMSVDNIFEDAKDYWESKDK